MKKLAIAFVTLSFLFTLGGCKKKEPVKVVAPGVQAPQKKTEEVKEKPIVKPQVQEENIENMSLEEINRKGYLHRIHFDFDKYNIREDQKPVLIRNAQWLKEHPTVKVLIEGHCDERGTEEYNLALGEKRAKAVRDFLISMGISPDRIKIVSYGKSRPLDPRHNEEAWAKNRRAEFVIIAR
ncbi:MAG: peptidoglycan-associated lipoprotein Pal [Candidatus Aminicenantes bacterium]|nr:peptidoglycan-associated lipoprotein Pal [Candidatus Aminicenantes bacterium]